ncbi:MAG: hypothetical protein K2N87_13735 [Eubacterium sp.]|nr:hypothetical protein [Eubacterium sp.]
MKVIVVYDDTGRKSEVISDIIGDKGFSDVVVKKRRLEAYYQEEISKEYPCLIWKKIRSPFEYRDLLKAIELDDADDVKILHCFSNYLITDSAQALLSFKKLAFIEDAYAVLSNKRVVAAMFPSADEYLIFCKSLVTGKKPWDLIRGFPESFEIEGVVDLGIIGNFIQCITGDFDSRYFNSLKGNEYTLVKSSPNKKKIRAEYEFYHLLPDDMKFWFVMPFHYKESEEGASYTMERLHMTDLAVKWVHGSMDEAEFEELMDKYFFFFQCRHEKPCTKKEYDRMKESLYEEKVIERIKSLKAFKEYQKIKMLLEASGDIDLESILARYFELKKAIEGRSVYPHKLVIGHGDPCFANALYNKSTKTLKFIDPKGAMTKDELWTDPYYDVAKLSHSVCGRYDFFNHALFDIKIGANFSYDLEIPFYNASYVEIFRQKLNENGFDYLSVRIYEASLFLSMLPLHIDNPHKVFGFILNVKNILEEIEKHV